MSDALKEWAMRQPSYRRVYPDDELLVQKLERQVPETRKLKRGSDEPQRDKETA